ncbi:MAG TPA: hypothetical protein VJ814_05910 [Gaiellaceae bacterium]|nr:hypothetical protein [Gaiellaceae bacterium]
MTLHVPRLPFSLDPLIAEAKRRARRRRWLILFVLVVAAGAAAATLELRPASGSGLAAVGGRPVTHVVIEYPPSTVYFNLKTGHEAVKTLGEEMWVDRQTNVHHIITTEGGRPVTEQLWTAHYGPATEAAAVNRFYAELSTDFRMALMSGTVKLVGRGTFEGHRVDWLSVLARRDRHWFVLRELGEVGVDARTYKPILLRGPSGKRWVYTRIFLARSIAYDPGDFKRVGKPRQLPAVPGQLSPGYAFGSPSPSASHSTVVRAPWLTAGPEVAGLELRAVRPFTIRKTKHRFSYGAPRPREIRGLALVYGPASTLPTPVNVYGRPRDPLAATRSTIVYEVPQGNTWPWEEVPADSIEVQAGYTTVGNHVVRTPWIGYLKKQGLYITISTPQGPRIPLQIARSLHSGSK